MAYQYPPNYSNGGQDAYYAYGQEYPSAQGYPGNGGGGLYPPDAGNAYAPSPTPTPPPPPPDRTVPPLYIPPPSRTPTPGYPPPPPHPPHSPSSSPHPYGPPSPQHPYGPPSPHQHRRGPPSPHQQHPHGPPSPHHPYGPPSPQQQHPYGPPSPHQRQHSQPHSYRHQHSHSSNTHYQPYPTKQASGPEPGLPTMNPSSSSSSSSSTPRPEPGLPTMHPEKLSSRPEPGLPTMHPEKLSSRPTHRPASFGMTAPSYVKKNKHRRRDDEGCNDCFSVCGCIRCTCTFCTLLFALMFLVAGIALFGYSRTLPSRCPDLCDIGGDGRFNNSTSDNLTNGTSGITNGDINENTGANVGNGSDQTLQRRLDDGILRHRYERDDALDHYDVDVLERRQIYNDDNNPVDGRINDAENKCNGLCSGTVYNALRFTGIALLCIGGFMLACVLLTMFCRAAKSGGRGSGCLFCC